MTAEILNHPRYRAAAAALAAGHDAFLAELIQLVQIPAPPFAEEIRAAAYRDKLAALGLQEVAIDEIGNVTAIRPGVDGDNGGFLVVSAHLDTVFPAGTDLTVRREGDRLYAPGIGDDTRGLAVILAMLRALDAAGITTRRDILICADVGEEGAGDLRGTRHLFTKGQYAGRIGGYFSLDGSGLDRLVTGAVGSLRYRLTFRGPGGHSLMDFGIVNPAHSLGDFLAGMARLTVPHEPRTTHSASVLGGGTSVNAIPQEVWVEIDLRSTDAGALTTLDQQMRALIEPAVAAENARNSTRKGPVTADLRAIGARPAAQLMRSGPLVDETRAILTAMGYDVTLEASSTDANIPLSLGLPAVTIGSGAGGGAIHTIGEWIDVEPVADARAQAAALAAILAVAGIVD